MKQPKAIYIHIPFCASKCHYCDFTAYLADGYNIDLYLDALAKEIAGVSFDAGQKIESVFIGGGTPTVLTTKQMKRLLAYLQDQVPGITTATEFTIEANPGTVDAGLFQAMLQGGVNRLSFGAQTFNDDLLLNIGRTHTSSEVAQSVRLAQELGFDNISLDLMFGLPKQSVLDVDSALSKALDLEVQHFSCYSLKIEQGTPFDLWHKKGQLLLPNEDDEFEMYALIRHKLAQHGYSQYEVSNFALPGLESRHNKAYWLNQQFYGFGCGAHGYVGDIRYSNIKSVKSYIQNLLEYKTSVKSEQHQVDLKEQQENFMIFGLRLLSGVDKNHFSNLYGQTIESRFGEVLHKLVAMDLITNEEDIIKLTDKGLIYGNEVFAAFLD